MNRCEITTRKGTQCRRNAKRDRMCTQHADIADAGRPTLTTLKAIYLRATVVGRGMNQRRLAAGWALVNLSDGNYADGSQGVGNRYATRSEAETRGEQIDLARRHAKRDARQAAQQAAKTQTVQQAPRGWSRYSRPQGTCQYCGAPCPDTPSPTCDHC